MRELSASAEAAGEIRVEFALVRAAAALALGDARSAEADLLACDAAARAAVDPGLVRRLDWAAAYVSSALGRPPGARAYGAVPLGGRWTAPPRPARETPTIAIMDYRSPDLRRVSLNIGDYVQTLAAMRHLARFAGVEWRAAQPEVADIMQRLAATWPAGERIAAKGVADLVVLDRDQTWPARTMLGDRVVWAILNGWYDHRAFDAFGPFPAPANVEPILLSYHLARPQDLTPPVIDWLRRVGPVGCRDWATVYTLLGAGVDAFFSGCLTTTLAVAENVARSRAGSLRVEAPGEDGEAEDKIIHHRPELRTMAFHEALSAAWGLIETYSAAEDVVTSRLHCYLPCRALGTPVRYEPPRPGDRRMEGLLDIDDAAFALMRQRLSQRLSDILRLVFDGRSRDEVREAWRALCADDVRAARRRVFGDETIAAGPRKTPDYAMARARPAEVTVALAFDDRLLGRAKALVRSLRAATTAPLRLAILSRNITSGQLVDVAAAAEPIDVRIFDMAGRFDGVDVSLARGTTVSTMDRLYLDQLLPDIDRLVYLDLDTICLGDIAELAAFEPSRLGVAARPIPMAASATIGQQVELAARGMSAAKAGEFRRWVAANADFRAPAFNAGVLVLSLARLRDTGTMARAIDLVERFGLNDQEALNLACAGDYAVLPASWNAMPYADWIDAPRLLHWAGDVKPWSSGRAVRAAAAWRKFDDAPAATRVGSADYWRDPVNFPQNWDERARMAAAWVDAPARALDLGCGPRMALKGLMPEGSEYRGADLRAWSEEVEQVDLNANEFPAGKWDLVFLLGVAEYLERPGIVLNRIRRAAGRLILSYCHPKPCYNREERRRLGWINAISEARLAEVLQAAGWKAHATKVFGENADHVQILYDVRPVERVAPPKPAAAGLSPLCRAVRTERLTYLRPEKLTRLEAAAREAGTHAPTGDFAEFGMALGGSGIVIASQARSFGRRFFGFDVFAMIPPPASEHDGDDARARYATIAKGGSRGLGGDVYYGYQSDLQGKVAEAFGRHGLPVDGRDISLVEGLFEATLPQSGLDAIAFAHIDCDWYDPVAFCLRETAARLVPGGVVVVDDYHDWSGCRAAVDHFLAERADFTLDDGANAILRRAR